MADRLDVPKIAPVALKNALARELSVFIRLAVAFSLLCAVLGCNRTTLMTKMIPEKDAALAEHYMDAVRLKDYETIEQHADPSIAGPDLRDKLAEVTSVFSSTHMKPLSVKPVAISFVGHAGSATNTSITLEYEFSDEWVLAEVTTQKVNGVSTITGVHAEAIQESVESQNSFSFNNKGLSQYVVFLFAVLAPLLTLYALVQCVKTPIKKRKWLWIVFILIGVGKLTVNWTTGQVFVAALALQVISGGATALGYAPWMISASLPLGAIIFLIYRDSIRSTPSAEALNPRNKETYN